MHTQARLRGRKRLISSTSIAEQDGMERYLWVEESRSDTSGTGVGELSLSSKRHCRRRSQAAFGL